MRGGHDKEERKTQTVYAHVVIGEIRHTNETGETTLGNMETRWKEQNGINQSETRASWR